LKIYLYGYLNRVQSSRRLERETPLNRHGGNRSSCPSADFIRTRLSIKGGGQAVIRERQAFLNPGRRAIAAAGPSDAQSRPVW
jgi:hypothetical protein